MYVGSIDPDVLWEMLIGGTVVCSFLAAIVLWLHSLLRQAKRARLRRDAFISAALNNLNQGVMITDRRNRVVFCNDRFLDIYGLSRADVASRMTGRDLIEMRRKRGLLSTTVEEYATLARRPEGLVTELPGGRSVLSKLFHLPDGGAIGTHEDCTEQHSLSEQLASTKQFLKSLLDNVPVCVAAKAIENGRAGRYIFANRAWENSGNSPAMKPSASALPSFSIRRRPPTSKRPIARLSTRRMDRFATNSRWSVGPRSESSHPPRIVARNKQNRPEFLLILFEDVTERRSLSRELEHTKKFLEVVVDNVPVSLIVERVSDGKYLLANRSAEVILNRPREEATGLTAKDIFNPREARLIVARDEAAIKKRGLLAEEHPISTKDGLRLFLTRRVTLMDDGGEPQYLIKTYEDVTDRRQAESHMAHMAYHDGLTDLPNRAAFLQALSQMIEACSSSNEKFAVLSVDLDGLKEINDVFGHATGDKVLVEVARRIQSVARGGVVARLSGDEFGLIIDGKQPEAGKALAQQLLEAMAREFQIDGKTVRTGLTTGISVFPDNGADAASLLANAGAALFRAKAKSRGAISLYEPEMDQQIRDRRVLHQELSLAIKPANSHCTSSRRPIWQHRRRERDHRLRGAGAMACIRSAVSSRRAISFRSPKKAA